ncbi:cytosine deaminase [Cystobasidiomycetes sp. EMM_F5]
MSPPSSVKTPPTTSKLSSQDELGMKLAIKEAQEGLEQGGVPIGACLIQNSTQKVLGTGRNLRCQEDSPILHGETSCLRNIECTPPCLRVQCALEACYCSEFPEWLLEVGFHRFAASAIADPAPFDAPENDTFVGGEDWLVAKGVEVVNVGESLDLYKRKTATS